MARKFDPYKVLGVEPEADEAAIKSARKRRSKETHPDKKGGDAEQFQQVQRAWLVLSNPEKRHKFDETGDFDETVKDDPAKEALSLISSILMEALGGEGDPFQCDLVEVIRNHIKTQVIPQFQGIVAKQRRIMERSKRMSGRFKVQKGPNRIEGALVYFANETRRSLLKNEGKVEILRLAVEMLDDYDFTKDAPPEFSEGSFTTTFTTATWG